MNWNFPWLSSHDITNTHANKNGIFVLLLFFSIFFIPVYGDNTSETLHPVHIVHGIPLDNSYPLDLNITINTTGYSREIAVDENKKRINYLLSSMLDPTRGNMNLSDIEVTPYTVSLMNVTNMSLEKVYQNEIVYFASSTIRVNTTVMDQKRLFRNTMPTLLHDDTLVKASYLATLER